MGCGAGKAYRCSAAPTVPPGPCAETGSGAGSSRSTAVGALNGASSNEASSFNDDWSSDSGSEAAPALPTILMCDSSREMLLAWRQRARARRRLPDLDPLEATLPHPRGKIAPPPCTAGHPSQPDPAPLSPMPALPPTPPSISPRPRQPPPPAIVADEKPAAPPFAPAVETVWVVEDKTSGRPQGAEASSGPPPSDACSVPTPCFGAPTPAFGVSGSPDCRAATAAGLPFRGVPVRPTDATEDCATGSRNAPPASRWATFEVQTFGAVVAVAEDGRLYPAVEPGGKRPGIPFPDSPRSSTECDVFFEEDCVHLLAPPRTASYRAWNDGPPASPSSAGEAPRIDELMVCEAFSPGLGSPVAWSGADPVPADRIADLLDFLETAQRAD